MDGAEDMKSGWADTDAEGAEAEAEVLGIGSIAECHPGLEETFRFCYTQLYF